MNLKVFFPKMCNLTYPPTIRHGRAPLDPIHCAKSKKNPYSGSRVMTANQFWTQNGALVLKNFLGKTIDIIFMYLLAPFIVEDF